MAIKYIFWLIAGLPFIGVVYFMSSFVIPLYYFLAGRMP